VVLLLCRPEAPAAGCAGQHAVLHAETKCVDGLVLDPLAGVFSACRTRHSYVRSRAGANQGERSHACMQYLFMYKSTVIMREKHRIRRIE
jgi:hypothetical protein